MRSLRWFILALPMMVFGSIAWAEAPPTLLHAWGSEGTRLGQFQLPTGVAFDSEGQLVVTDSHNGRIQLFTTNGDPVELLRVVKTPEVQMHHPQSVGTDPAGRMYVADCEGNCIWVFDVGGVFAENWGTDPAAEHYNLPGSVESDPQGRLFLADWGNHRIHRLGVNGACSAEWSPTLGSMFAVACDPYGHVFVADTDNNRILKYTCDGQLLAEWGSAGSAAGQFNGPLDLACDATGNVYVVDTNNYRIQKFSGQGRFLTMWGSYGEGAGQFVKAASIAVNASGLIAVVDETANRVQVFGTPAQVLAHMDIMPGRCPNVLEWGTGGNMQVALLGTATFDPLQVEPATVRMASVAPVLFGIGDSSQPASDSSDPCGCTTAGPDGFDDLILTFDVAAVHAALGGGAHGTVVAVELLGALRDGTPFTANGCMEIEESLPSASTQPGRAVVRVAPMGPARFGISFSLPANARTKLTVHDVSGRLVARLVDEVRAKGDHAVTWNTGDLRSGVYFARLVADEQVVVKQFALTR
jgi:DNA-binding beta-propeller fold protein YncE